MFRRSQTKFLRRCKVQEHTTNQEQTSIVSQRQDLVEQLFGEIETHLLLLMCGSVWVSCICVDLQECVVDKLLGP